MHRESRSNLLGTHAHQNALRAVWRIFHGSQQLVTVLHNCGNGVSWQPK